jgi:hypothetical protein
MLNMCNSNHETMVWGNPIKCPFCQMTDDLKSSLNSLKEKLGNPPIPHTIESVVADALKWIAEQRDRLTTNQ